MVNSRNIVFLVGNGFDINVLSALNQSPNTSYSHFYNFIKYAHPECDNILIKEMEKRKESEYENWSDFEKIISELSRKNDLYADLMASLQEFQDYFSEFLNDIVTPSFLRYLDTFAKQEIFKSILRNELLEKKYNFFDSSMRFFLVDLDRDISNCKFRGFRHNETLHMDFFNFNYTSLLDNLLYLGKDNFQPKKYKNSPNNFNFHVNPKLIPEVHTDNPDKFCKLEYNIHHPHGIQSIPRSILFGNGENTTDYFAKPYWARYDEKFKPIIDNAELYVIYGMSISETDKWWWDKIIGNIIERDVQLIIYNFLADDMAKCSEDIKDKFLKAAECEWRYRDKNRKDKILNNIFIVNHSNKYPSQLFRMIP